LFAGLSATSTIRHTSDKSCAPILCPFESRVISIGSPIGQFFSARKMQSYLNLKVRGEFNSANRPKSSNGWPTSPLAPAYPASPAEAAEKPSITK
jgi:hypothetical protein